jgi:hypothetical protein
MMARMTPRPVPSRVGRLGAVVFVVLALGGTLLGHALVWSLVGGASPGLAAARSVHNYLKPLGGVLVLVAVATSWAVWESLGVLRATAERLRRSLRRSPRPGAPDDAGRWDARQAAARTPRLVTWWSALLAVQLCVYSVQENLEARAAHVPMPGIGVLTAQHGAPVVLHAAVALGLAALATVVWAALSKVRREVEQVIRLLRAVAARRRSVLPHPRPRPGATHAPVARFGLSFISRPPPLVVG